VIAKNYGDEMNIKRNFWILSAALLLCYALGGTRAAAQVPTTTVNGIITDPHDATIGGARVAARNRSTETVHETLTNTDGLYAIPDLPAGSYDVRIEARGFTAREFADVQLEAGRASTLDAKLELASAQETIHIDDSSILGGVELTQSMIQGEITSTAIETLPLNGRNFLDLAYLIPGNRPAPNFDPTKTNTLEISSAGGFGRGGNITVDGGDNNDEVVGGTLANFPQDSVQEFQIATGRFTAEVGRSGNSIINVVTKSGANEYHGSAFLFERNRNLQARPATLDPLSPTPPFDRQQYGGSIGGPIVKDKTFWFASGEYRHQNSSILTGERIYGPAPAADTIPNTSAPAPLRDALFSTRVDHQLNSTNSLVARYSFNRSTDTAEAQAFQPTPLSTAAERQDSLNRFHSLVLGWTSTLSPTQVNSLIFHFDTFLNTIPPFAQDAPTTFPDLGLSTELVFPGLADGVNFNTPQSTHLNRYQLRDGFAWTIGKHNIHLGGEFQHFNAFGIVNPFGSGSVVLTSNFGFADLNGDGVINDLDIPIAVALRSQGPVKPVPIPPISNNYFATYAQDDWRIARKLTLNLGLRWEYDTNMTGTDSTHQPCADITTPPTQPCVWLASVIDIRRQPDKKDFGPRVGFAYDPLGRGRTVIRGGYGIYYDRIILEVPGYERVADDRAFSVNAFFGSACTFPGGPPAPSLDSCFAPGASFAAGSPTLANPFSGPHAPGGVGAIVLGKDTHHPMFEQFSLGLQQQFGQDWLFSADGLHVFGDRQIIAQYLRSTTSTSPYISCPGSPALCTVTDPLTGISDNVTVGSSAAKSWYDGLLVSLQHKPVKLGSVTYLFNASYTLSKTLDYSDNDQVPSYNAVESVNLNEGTAGLRGEKGYASSDERHRLTIYGHLTMPWGFSLSPLYTYGSGVPADTYVPSLRNPSRLPILSRNALGRGIANSDQLNRVIDLWNALPVCPAPAPCNPGGQLEHVPGGISFSSPFNSFDLRLVKAVRITERQHFDLIAESFNLFNSVNVRGSNYSSFSGRDITLVPKGTDISGVDGGFFTPVSTAGGFFGSGGPRAFQFAVRYTF
jgi:hypothetical protein